MALVRDKVVPSDFLALAAAQAARKQQDEDDSADAKPKDRAAVDPAYKLARLLAKPMARQFNPAGDMVASRQELRQACSQLLELSLTSRAHIPAAELLPVVVALLRSARVPSASSDEAGTYRVVTTSSQDKCTLRAIEALLLSCLFCCVFVIV
jgi:hypothetical protein